MKTIYYYYYESFDGKGKFKRGTSFTAEKYEVVAENNNFIAIGDYSLTSIAKKDGHGATLNKPDTYIRFDDPLFGSHVYFSLYSEIKLSASEIKELLKTGVKSKTKFLGDIDLSVIDHSLAINEVA